jgi:hypothetical protein
LFNAGSYCYIESITLHDLLANNLWVAANLLKIGNLPVNICFILEAKTEPDNTGKHDLGKKQLLPPLFICFSCQKLGLTLE